MILQPAEGGALRHCIGRIICGCCSHHVILQARPCTDDSQAPRFRGANRSHWQQLSESSWMRLCNHACRHTDRSQKATYTERASVLVPLDLPQPCQHAYGWCAREPDARGAHMRRGTSPACNFQVSREVRRPRAVLAAPLPAGCSETVGALIQRAVGYERGGA